MRSFWYNDYKIVADNLFNADHRRVSYRIQAPALDVDPNFAGCEMTDAQIRKAGCCAPKGAAPTSPCERTKRAYMGLEQASFKEAVAAWESLSRGGAGKIVPRAQGAQQAVWFESRALVRTKCVLPATKIPSESKGACSFRRDLLQMSRHLDGGMTNTKVNGSLFTG